ncbi:hypothetical protein G8C41_01400 [Apibacter sp. B3706]|uniref:hypothetical protein n=1 Tax=unclassified Apibacter TaxID=2630820 RepID=UPI000CF869DC|nr:MULTISPECIES: hypothetical protein [unclassified Apibacter]MXP05343.1 hypothetical protein [Apibacter sp. B3546]MXP11742.1 hypothetical protein [Apibacter sp. B3239]PQL90251.1 hypothetical protein C4S75_09800 [Apibacter sp. wkB309]QII69528.1 hypothetical protein G8C41_01400 [Apibacter sp. B3706]
MKKLFSIIFIALVYNQSFAYNILQVVVETEEVPPIPNAEGEVVAYGGGIGIMEPNSTPINFIVPFLLISAIFIMFYIFKKKRIKSV